MSFFPLWTTFVHILAEQRKLSKRKFRQIPWKEGVSSLGSKKYNLAGGTRRYLQQIVLTWLIQVAPDVLVKQAKCQASRITPKCYRRKKSFLISAGCRGILAVAGVCWRKRTFSLTTIEQIDENDHVQDGKHYLEDGEMADDLIKLPGQE